MTGTTSVSSMSLGSSSIWMAAVVTIGTIGTMLGIHAAYITQLLHRISPSSLSHSSGLPSRLSTSTLPSYNREYHVPELFIYRRTKKTGSSSMLTALLDQLTPFGYTPLYYGPGEEMDSVVRNEYLQTHSKWNKRRKLLVAEHNHVTKSYHPYYDAVIADTVRDGYDQITSFCRYVKKVESCSGDEILDCLRNETTLVQNVYRWAGKESEDIDTYIDLPLSSAHPALSTTVLRTVFPNITLDISKFNVRSTRCRETEEIRQVYNELYAPLEEQVHTLRQRILMLTGYPCKIDKKVEDRVSLEDVMKAAEKLERQKYDIESLKKKEIVKGYSEAHHELMRTTKHWSLKDGKLYIKSRRK